LKRHRIEWGALDEDQKRVGNFSVFLQERQAVAVSKGEKDPSLLDEEGKEKPKGGRKKTKRGERRKNFEAQGKGSLLKHKGDGRQHPALLNQLFPGKGKDD